MVRNLCFTFAFLILLWITWAFSSCQSFSKKEDTWQGPFFNFKKYFKQQSAMLIQNKTRLIKRINKENEKEEKIINIPDWQQEFSLFSEADLNRKAWVGLYRIDSLAEDGYLMIHYEGLDSSLTVKSVSILMSADTIKQLTVNSRFQNFYYQSDLWMQYTVEKGYIIRGNQSLRAFRKHQFEITGTFLE